MVDEFLEPVEDVFLQRLRSALAAVPGLGPGSRALDVGSGTGVLIPLLRELGVQDILALDVSPRMVDALNNRWPPPSVLGNEAGVRTWLGDLLDVPPYQGPFDVIIMNSMFGNVFDQRSMLLQATTLLCDGGHVLISHPRGRAWQRQLSANDPAHVPYGLPDKAELEGLIRGLPLRVTEVVDEAENYYVVLQVPPNWEYDGGPVLLKGPVVEGFQRGSRQMGTPTANIDPDVIREEISAMERGVYFGYAQVEPRDRATWSEADLEVQPMVLNIGKRPTVADDGDVSVEVHIMHEYAQDFYGETLRAQVVGHIRPEVKFGGIDELISRIMTDIGLARKTLKSGAYSADQSFFLG